MPEKVAPGPVSDDRCIREAVCIHTKKIFDSCKDEQKTFKKVLSKSPAIKNSPVNFRRKRK